VHQFTKSILINEQQYLCCLLNNEALVDVDFDNHCTNTISQAIYTALVTLKKNGSSFTISGIVSEALKEHKDVSKELIHDLKEKVEANPEDFEYYKNRLIRDHAKYLLQTKTLKELQTSLASKADIDVKEIENSVKELEWAITVIKGKNSRILNTKQALELYQVELENRGDRGNFIPSGCRYLDNYLYGGGFIKGTINTIFGLSGIGKSTYARKLVNGQINRQIPNLYIPMEMGVIPSMDCLIASRTGITINELSRIDEELGKLPEYVMEAFYEEKRKMEKLPYFHIVQGAGMNMTQLHSIIRDVKKENGRPELIVTIDLLTMLDEFVGDNKAMASEDAINQLFELVQEEQIVAVPVIQARRNEKTTVSNIDDIVKFKPSTEMIKNSGAFEERSRVVIGVHRPKHYAIKFLPDDPETKIMNDIMEVQILKQNMGSLGEIKYLYTGETSKLLKYEEGEE
jgi:replicative DNA helicase